ncbi:MAG: SPOR domain-containing protein [Burkholderiaceae bacterium]
MALLKFLRRSDASADSAGPVTSAAAQAVEAARRQARRRLLGAVVLLGVGIIGFPLVFQTQPRPIPVDIPIEIPRKENAPPLTAAGGVPLPAAGAAASKARAPVVATVEPAPAPGGTANADAPKDPKVSPPALGGACGAAPASPVEVEVLPPAVPKAETAKADAGKAEQPAATADKDRGRFVVQAGSFTDLDAVRDTRAKLERLGLKTYTQAAVVDGVTRVRVRVGPFATRQEAQDVQNKIKAAGLTASLLQL